MEIYSIEKLIKMKEEERQNILCTRCEILVNLISKIFVNKEIESWEENFSDWLEKSKDNTKRNRKVFTIEKVTNNKGEYFYGDDRSSVNIKIFINKLTCSNKKKEYSIMNDDLIEETLSELANDLINKGTRIRWSKNPPQSNNYINMYMNFDTNIIAPDFILFNEYKKQCKQERKESKRKILLEKLEEQLKLNVQELMWRRFNIIREDHLYIPTDKNELMEYIKRNTKIATSDQEALKEVIKRYSDNEDIVVTALNMFNDDLFQYASDRLKNDKDFILKVIDDNYPMSLVNIVEHIAPHLQDDDEIMTKAINVSGHIIRAASDRIKNDKQYCMLAVTNQDSAYGQISEKMRMDKDILLKVMETRGDYFALHPEVKTNKELLINAFLTSPDRSSFNLLLNTSEEFKNDKEVALAAIQCYANNVSYIGEELRNEIGNNEPIEYLIKSKLNEKLHEEVNNNKTSISLKIKI